MRRAHKPAPMMPSSTVSTPWITFGLALGGWGLMLGAIVAGAAFILLSDQGFPADLMSMMVALVAVA